MSYFVRSQRGNVTSQNTLTQVFQQSQIKLIKSNPNPVRVRSAGIVMFKCHYGITTLPVCNLVTNWLVFVAEYEK